MTHEDEKLPFNDYASMVAGLFKPGTDILAQLTPSDAELIHAGMGASGEAGELLDAIKKATIYRKDIDRENVIEELGDLEFFMEAVRQNMGITRAETLEHNFNKLMRKRYPNGYSDEAARLRADKVG